jgi:hypothetical protein
MLGKVFARFVEKSPMSVMVRGTLERVLGAEQLDAWFARTAQKQYTRTVLFSTVYDVRSQGVFRIKPSVRAAYRDHEDKVGASLISLYNKLNGVETHTAAALVRSRAAVVAPLIEQLDGARVPLDLFTCHRTHVGSKFSPPLPAPVRQRTPKLRSPTPLTCVAPPWTPSVAYADARHAAGL